MALQGAAFGSASSSDWNDAVALLSQTTWLIISDRWLPDKARVIADPALKLCKDSPSYIPDPTASYC